MKRINKEEILNFPRKRIRKTIRVLVTRNIPFVKNREQTVM